LRWRFQTGIAYNLLGAVFNQGSTFAVNMFVANLLGRHVFGEYTMVQSTLLTVGTIAQLGTGYTATRYVAEFRSVDKPRTGRVLGMLLVFSTAAAVVSTLGLLVSAQWLASVVLKAPDLAPALRISAGVLAFSVVNGFLMGALAGLESYRRLARALVLSGIIYFGVCAALAWAGGLNGAVLGLLLSASAQCVLLARALVWECRPQGIAVTCRGIAGERGIFSRFALPTAMGGFTPTPALWMAGALLVRQPNGYAQMGLYSASFSLMAMVLFLPSIANNVGMSIINHNRGTGNERAYQGTFWMNLAITAAIVIAGATTVALLGSQMLHLFGKEFVPGYPVLLILLAAAVPEGLTVALSQVIQSQDKMWLAILGINLPRDATIVFVAYWLAATHGAQGLAMAYLSGRLLSFVIISWLVLRIGLGLPSPVTSTVVSAGGALSRDAGPLAGCQAAGSCPLCGANTYRVHRVFSRMLDLPGHTPARVQVCHCCGFRFLYPYVPDELLAEMYSEAYFTGQGRPEEGWLASGSGESYDSLVRARLPKFLSSLKLIFRHVENPRNLLDVGAATGAFLSIAREKGLCVFGMELSPYAAQLGSERYGLGLSVCKVEDYVTEERYDIVHLNHVLEHRVEPHRAVAAIERLLSEKGVVYVEVPYQFNCVEMLKYRLLGTKLAFNIHSIHHPIFFSPESLVRVFAMHNLKVLELRLFDPDRYVAATLLQSVKRLVWRGLAHLQQGVFIEAIFGRK
jgi:O-antigen/teichoic acid export membrane protein/2-polyprenyl-3-methyl-5-hydroxy-6-metoxy-1,4-benzoquinol methylase